MRRRFGAVAAAAFAALPTCATRAHATPVEPRYAFETAWDNVNGGRWYRDENNETATLAWGEAYVLRGLIAMYRATGESEYLLRLADQADGVLAHTDAARGTPDFTGAAEPCWQDRHYQANGEAYCYVVHSGMILAPLVEAAVLVNDPANGLGGLATADGTTLAQRAAAWIALAQANFQHHEREWNGSDAYNFDPAARFLDHPGGRLPLNQSNVYGTMLIWLWQATGDVRYRDRATALAQAFRRQVRFQGGLALWNYAGGAYAAPGEDISHAGINVELAVVCHTFGLVFSDADLDAMAATFTQSVAASDTTFADHLGGGDTNGDGYRPQIGRWLLLADRSPPLYAAVRQHYLEDYPAENAGSGSVLLAYALLAQYARPLCDWRFYHVDWDDRGDTRVATAYGANIEAFPGDFARPCLARLQARIPVATTIEQWDGDAYHAVGKWAAGAGLRRLFAPYDPHWPFPYEPDVALFQFRNVFDAAHAVEIAEPAALTPTTLGGAPEAVTVGVELHFTPTATGEPPFWFALRDAPGRFRIDRTTGEVTGTPSSPGPLSLTVRLTSETGVAEQVFTVPVGDVPDAAVALTPDAAVATTPDAGVTPSLDAAPTPQNDTGIPPPSGQDAALAFDATPGTTPDATPDPVASQDASYAPVSGTSAHSTGCTLAPAPGRSPIPWLTLALALPLSRRDRRRGLAKR